MKIEEKQNRIFLAKILIITCGLCVLLIISGCQKTNDLTFYRSIEKKSETSGICKIVETARLNMKALVNADKNELEWSWCIKPEEYNELHFIDTDLLAAKGNNDKYSIVNINGEKIVPNEYLYVFKFNDGLASVSTEEGSYFINKKGENVFNKYFEDTYSFNDGMAAIKEDGLWGFIDKSGNTTINNQFEDVKSIEEGIAVVKKDNEWGVINKKGKTIVNFQYDEIWDFHEGIAAVMKNNKWGYIDKKGNIIADLEFDQVENFSNDLAAVMKDGKWGFIDINGDVKIQLKYDEVGNFSEEKAAVKLINYKDDLDEWAYIDKDNNIIIDFYPYDAASDSFFCVGEFHEGLAFVSKSLMCIIDINGNMIFNGLDSKYFLSSTSYNEEHDAIPAFIFTDDSMKVKKYGLVGLKGNQRLEPKFDYIDDISGDYVVVENIVDGDYKYGLIKINDARIASLRCNSRNSKT